MPELKGWSRAQSVWNRGRSVLLTVAAAGLVLVAVPSHANEPGSNLGWQFMGPAARSVGVSTLDLMSRQNGGYFNQWQNNYTYNTDNSTTTVYGGGQTNCTLSTTAIGNTGSPTGYSSTASPSVASSPSTSAYAAGNQASGSTTGGGGNLTAPLNTVQDSYGSPVGASVSGAVSSAGVGQLNSGTSTSSQILNNNQSNTASPTSSSVANSSACSGTVGQTMSGSRRR
jgi:hypothetical protein